MFLQLNEDLEGHIDFLAQTGPFSVPIRCVTKKCQVSCQMTERSCCSRQCRLPCHNNKIFFIAVPKSRFDKCSTNVCTQYEVEDIKIEGVRSRFCCCSSDSHECLHLSLNSFRKPKVIPPMFYPLFCALFCNKFGNLDHNHRFLLHMKCKTAD